MVYFEKRLRSSSFLVLRVTKDILSFSTYWKISKHDIGWLGQNVNLSRVQTCAIAFVLRNKKSRERRVKEINHFCEYIPSMIRLRLVHHPHSPKHEDKSDLEDLKFEEVCPVWSEKLRIGLDRRDRIILATDSKNCLVGEAWGFTAKQTGYYFAPLIPFVGCWGCVKFGQKIGKVARKNEDSCTAKDFEPLISEFIAHWNQKHKSIMNCISHIPVDYH